MGIENRDPNIQALKRWVLINHGSTLPVFTGLEGVHQAFEEGHEHSILPL